MHGQRDQIHQTIKTYKGIDERGPWIVRCVPGLGRTATAELRFRRVISREDNPALLRQRNHDLIFMQRSRDTPPNPILRIPEEIHYCILYGRYKISKAQIEKLANILGAQKQTFYLAVTADGSHFSRHDTKRWLSNTLQGLNVSLAEKADQALWVFCIEEAYYICLPRCSFADAPFREKRLAERTGALPPTVAAAMAFLGEPKPGEIVLDPVCGTGTLLAEVYAYAPDARLIGVDIDENAIHAALQNLSHVQNKRLIVGNGINIDLPPHSVTLFLANLPFGKQYGDKRTNPQLYTELLAEMLRLGVPDRSRAVLISSDIDAVESSIQAHPKLGIVKRVPVKVRGEKASIFVLRLGG
jgi:predicted RNA methylase